jgi:hypothetical protein
MQRAEIVFFMRPEEEEKTGLFLTLNTAVVDQPIVDLTGALYRRWHPGHGVDIHDVLLAATAMKTGGIIIPCIRSTIPCPRPWSSAPGNIFRPARGNVLLVDDAAGLIFPITFEGIGSALKSAVLAAEAVRRSSQTGRDVACFYLDLLHPVLEVIENLLTCQENLAGNTTRDSSDPKTLSWVLTAAHESTLRIT